MIITASKKTQTLETSQFSYGYVQNPSFCCQFLHCFIGQWIANTSVSSLVKKRTNCACFSKSAIKAQMLIVILGFFTKIACLGFKMYFLEYYLVYIEDDQNITKYFPNLNILVPGNSQNI